MGVVTLTRLIKLVRFLPRDAMRKRGLCCPSVHHVGVFYLHDWSYCQTSSSAR